MAKDPGERRDPFGLESLKDPDVEARERVRLRFVEYGETPSPEIQQKFIEYIEHYEEKNITSGSSRCVPEELFTAQAQNGVTNRAYYARPLETDFSGNDRKAELMFSEKEPGSFSAHIQIHGEHKSFEGKKKEYIRLSFIPERVLSKNEASHFGQVSVTAGGAGRDLFVHYRNSGELSSISFAGEGFEQRLGERNLDIETLLESGKQSYITGSIEYHAKYLKDERKIQLKRLKAGEILDSIIVPAHLDTDILFQNLFSEQFRRQPYSAGIEEDNEWKSVNLGSIGIIWDKNSSNPNS